jgi:hypothetical protein
MSQVRRHWRVERLLQTEMVHYEDCIGFLAASSAT